MNNNLYEKLKDKHAKEVNEFPMFFAFNEEQFNKGMEKIGLKNTDTDKIYSLGCGGFYRKSDAQALQDMFKRHKKEIDDNIINDVIGDNFIYNMFCYELNNHEYGYTQDVSDTLEALGFTMDDINKNKNLLHGFNKACNDCK